jgi:hypothetical protein
MGADMWRGGPKTVPRRTVRQRIGRLPGWTVWILFLIVVGGGTTVSTLAGDLQGTDIGSAFFGFLFIGWPLTWWLLRFAFFKGFPRCEDDRPMRFGTGIGTHYECPNCGGR